MPSFNKVIIAGFITRDPELRFTPKGTAICKISVAINRKWKNEAGELKEEVTFVDVDSFGKQAETVGKHFKKGSPILVEGRLRNESWEDKETKQKRYRMGVVMESFQILESNGRKDERPASSPAVQPETNPAQTPVEQDDVPF